MFNEHCDIKRSDRLVPNHSLLCQYTPHSPTAMKSSCFSFGSKHHLCSAEWLSVDSLCREENTEKTVKTQRIRAVYTELSRQVDQAVSPYQIEPSVCFSCGDHTLVVSGLLAYSWGKEFKCLGSCQGIVYSLARFLAVSLSLLSHFQFLWKNFFHEANS